MSPDIDLEDSDDDDSDVRVAS
ncbi:hypothetical protein BIW11_04212, partial [Tropilaelaps mercedesae]